ncbi:MAG: hypothetical protein CL763_10325 [Chloroflexi bacterium]|nr:hypothetical protein [Chloroflexota bacterium]|tara:strand:- start:509 stop:2197 length:1689 start_codon:yes stop_codon:yes gene_type:complete
MNQKISDTKFLNEKKYISLYLVGIAIISLFLKLYTIDFTLPLTSDGLSYLLNSIAHVNGDFSQHPHRSTGWSLFLYPIFSLIDSNDILVYSNISRIVGISLSLISIPVVYCLGNKFFNEKYSLVVACLFAFEPHLNYNSGFGLTEPLYHLLILISFYFLFNEKSKFIIISLVFASFVWWTRFNGITIFIIITIIYFLTQKKDSKTIRNFSIALFLFLIIISPMLIQRADQYGDPFYFAYTGKVFSGSYEQLTSIQVKENPITASEYIENNGIILFIENFVIQGISNIFQTLSRILFPFLIILLPIGIFFSIRAFDQKTKFIKINWVIIILSLLSLTLTFSIIAEKRYLYFIFPFLIIFATIPIQRFTDYGLSTFSFSQRQKNISLIIIISIILLLSVWFTARYDKPDLELENEKIEFSNFAINNLSGNLQREMGHAFDYYALMLIDDPKGNFKNCKVNFVSDYCGIDRSQMVNRITVTGDSLEEIILSGKKYNLKYILSNEKPDDIGFHEFLDELYFTEKNYVYLTKVFDSNDYDYKKLKFKIFEIDYEKFEELFQKNQSGK